MQKELANSVLNTAEMRKFVATSFEVVKKRKSNFVKEGTGVNGIPAEHLSAAKTMFLEPISRLFLGKGNGYMPTQYVIGANTHYINDYYEDKNGALVCEAVTPDQAKSKGYQFRPGLQSQGYNLKEQYAVSLEKGICFNFGKLDVRDYGDDPVLLRFINEHELNNSAPRAKENNDPKRLKLFQFNPSIPELKASTSKNVENFDDDFKALELVKNTRTQKADGTYSYNESMLNAIMAILEDGKGLQPGEVVQKFELVGRYARKSGPEFLRIINGTMEEFKLDIAMAEQFNVIKIGATEAKFIDGGGKTILTFEKSGDKDACVQQLVLHLISEGAGRLDHAEMERQVEIAKLKAISK